MRVQQAGFVNRDMTTQVAHKRQCSEQRALRGVTKGLQVKSYAGDGMGPGSDEIHYLTGYGGRTDTVHGFYSTCLSEIVGTPTAMTAENIPDHRFGLVIRNVQRTKELPKIGEVQSHFWSATRGSPAETGKAQETHSRHEKKRGSA